MNNKSLLNLNTSIILKLSPKLSLDSIKDRIKDIKWPLNALPKVCEITINTNCNNKCLFCYSTKDMLYSKDVVELKKIIEVIYMARKNGANLLNIIGGEPTLRNDLNKIVEYAKKIDYPCIKISSNGIKLSDKKYLKALIKSGINMFNLSLHSSNPCIHNRLVGINNSFNKVIKAMENIKEEGAELGIDCVLNRLNYKTFPSFMKLTYDKFKVNYYNIIYIHYRGMAKTNYKVLAIELSEVAKYIKKGLKIIEESGFPIFARIIGNIHPCFLPEYINILTEWERTPYNREVLLIKDDIRILSDIRNENSVYSKACKKCILYEKCRGYDKEYFEIFSDNFKPLKYIPKQRLKMIYEKN